jgi:heptosyltransferase-3
MSPLHRILVITPAQLGDVLICAPLIELAHARWPSASIDVLGFAGTLSLLAGNPDVSELIEIPRPSDRRAELRQAWRLLRRYDLALVTRTSDRAHLYGIVAARTRSVMWPQRSLTSAWKWLAADHGVESARGEHQVLQKLELLSPWATAPATVTVRPPAPVALPPAIEARLVQPCVVLHVPSMWRYKQWPAAHFRAVLDGLVGDGVQVVLTGSASATDQAQIAAVRGDAVPAAVLDVSGQLSMAQVGTLLGRAAAYAGPDTSVTHLAAAVGVPIVTVFGPTEPQDFGPWPREHPARQPWQSRAQRQQVGDIVMLQGPDLPGRTCVPCNRMGCEDRHDSASQCLEGLEPNRVLAELRRILAAAARTARR